MLDRMIGENYIKPLLANSISSTTHVATNVRVAGRINVKTSLDVIGKPRRKRGVPATDV
jgi:hypothetical protein